MELDPAVMEQRNVHLQKKYEEIKEKEVRYEMSGCEDADYIIVAFGSAARIAQKSVDMAREEGLKLGLFRPITLWPFPYKQLNELSRKVKGMLVAEINAGQMVFDVRMAAADSGIPVEHYGRLGGMIPTPDEIVTALKEKVIKK